MNRVFTNKELNDLLTSFELHDVVLSNSRDNTQIFNELIKLNTDMSLNFIGFMYSTGKGVKQDYNKALEYYKKSADLGWADAKYNIGYMYEKGRGVKQDYNKALEYYKIGCKSNHAPSLNRMGYLYRHNIVVKQDYLRALYYTVRAADLGLRCAMYNLGYMCENGMGFKQNYNEAFKYYKKAADLNHLDGILKIVQMYMGDKEIEKDYNEAFKYCKKAIIKGHVGSLYVMGWFYEYGNGVEKDIIKAYEFYHKAFKNDNFRAVVKFAEGNRKNMQQYLEFIVSKPDYETARELGDIFSEKEYTGSLILKHKIKHLFPVIVGCWKRARDVFNNKNLENNKFFNPYWFNKDCMCEIAKTYCLLK